LDQFEARNLFIAKGQGKNKERKLIKIGYARVSTHDQNLGLQMDALNKVGRKRIFADQGVSGATIEREGLSQAIAAAGKGACPRLLAADVDPSAGDVLL
jgi:predicted site-specific integrase-resolvase